MRSLTGLPQEKIDELESAFAEVYHEKEQRE